MSSNIPAGFNANAAVRFNAKYASNHLPLPAGIFADYPALAQPVDTEDFAFGVHLFQMTQNFPAASRDGKLGRNTASAMAKRYDTIDDREPYIVHNGRRRRVPQYPMQARYGVLTAFDAPNGYDIHRLGLHSSRGRSATIRRIVVHWGGINPDHLYRYMKTVSGTTTTKDDISTHFGCGPGEAFQYLDTMHKAWHAGWANAESIGVDVCQHCYPIKSAKYYDADETGVGVIHNPAPIGPDKVLSLDIGTAITTRQLVLDLLEIFELPVVLPEPYRRYTRKEVEASEITVWGHHHLSKSKSDIAPWWLDIFGELYDRGETQP